MMSSAQPLRQGASSWSAPLPLPSGGDWTGSLTSYADVDYVLLHARTNRTLSVSVTALDETGRASQLKAQPVIGMWAASDPEGSARRFHSFTLQSSSVRTHSSRREHTYVE